MNSDAILSYVNSDGTENVEEAENFISMFLNMNSSNEEVNLVNADGIILFSSNNLLIGNDLSTESYISNMMADGMSTQSDVFTSDSSGDSYVTFAIPLRSGNLPTPTDISMLESSPSESAVVNSEPITQEFTGAITIVVNVSEFSDALSSITVGGNESSYAYLLDSAGTLVYHPNGELVGTKIEVSAINEVVNQIQEGIIPESEILTYNYDGVEKYASYSIDSNNHWILVITAEKSEIFSSLQSASTKSFYISIIVIVILTIIAYLFAGTITNPIKKINCLFIKQLA